MNETTRSVSLGRANFLSAAARPAATTATFSTVGANAVPIVWLGGASPGGLALPPADPTPSHMYAPRGVWTDGERLIACDTGNHRVLIWQSFPTANGQPADVVLGQPDFFSEGPKTFFLPTGVSVIDGRLVVADAWHHRILAWDDVPSETDEPPTWVLGQANLEDVEENRGGEPSASSMYWPFGFARINGVFWVADTGNKRVLGWRCDGLPAAASPAEIILGQDDEHSRLDNRGGELTGMSFRWPHAIAGDDKSLFIADAGDHRVLGWTPAPTSDSDSANVVLGQEDLASMDEFKIRPQSSQRMRFPYAVVNDESRLFVADTSNNRVLVWHDIPRSGHGIGADTVIGQPDMDANGENRWASVSDDSMCWPYGLSLAGNVLAIADSGNNRVVIWRVT